MDNPNRRSYTARFVFTGDGEPIGNGTIEIVGSRIAAVHNRFDPRAEKLGNAAIIPGLVNAHTHLEFSDLAEPISPARPFADWIRGLVSHRRARTTAAAAIIPIGLKEAAHSGTTSIGEIATDDDVEAWTIPNGPRVTVFRELLGFGPEQVEPQLQIARRFLDDSVDCPTRQRRAALSPHAPYSVHPELLRRCVALVREYDVPIAMHLAETREELQLLDTGDGALRDMLESFDVWRDGALIPGTKPIEYLRTLAEAPRALIVHGNYLDDVECKFLAGASNLSLVYCPRTHHYFGHEPHPWRKVKNAGGNVALGTDSRASNPDLSLWRELQFVREQCDDLTDAELLRLGTINGAIALGIDEETGSLKTGNAADLAVVQFDAADSNTGLLSAGNFVIRTMIAGEWVAG